MREMIKMIVVLTGIALFSGGSLALLEDLTRETIRYQRLKFVKGPAIRAVLSGYDNDPIKDFRKDVELKESEGHEIRKSIFPAKRDGEVFAIAFEVMGTGYHGPLGIMIGIELKTGHLTGIRVMTHTETPGLGARAVEPEFYEQFSKKGVQDLELADKGGKINAISGASLTSQGVVGAIKKGLELFLSSRDMIERSFSSG